MQVDIRKKVKASFSLDCPVRPVKRYWWFYGLMHLDIKRIYTDQTEVPHRVKVCSVCTQRNNINNYIHTIFYTTSVKN